MTKTYTKVGQGPDPELPFVGHNHPFFGKYLPCVVPFVGQTLPLAMPATGKSRCTRQRGFTLVELMVVLAIIAISLTLAAPSFSTYLRSHRVKTAANDLLAHINLARNEALKRGVYVSLCRSPDPLVTTACQGSNINKDIWTNGWLVYALEFTDTAEGDYTSDHALIAVQGSAPTGTDIKAGGKGDRWLSFKSDGTLNETAAVAYSICNSVDLSATGKKIVIPMLGRPYITSPDNDADCDPP